ncbi:MAG: hypothetical protein ABIQ60_02545 [Burkholderiaceae bacterium]
MSGSDSSAPGSGVAPEQASPLSFSVHSMQPPALDVDARRTTRGRLKMLLVLLICVAPVVASYLTYFLIRPDGRTNYSDLIEPMRPIPDALPLTDLRGAPVSAQSLKGQWLLVVVSGGACDADCEKHLWIQRQLREGLGREKERLDKVWMIVDAAEPRVATLEAIETNTDMTVLRVSAPALAGWLRPASGRAVADNLYIVDPMGNWVMRVPADPEPAKLKRDLEKLLRASSSWDQPGR